MPTETSRSPVFTGMSSNFTGFHARDSFAFTYASPARSSRPQNVASISSSSLSAFGMMTLKSFSCESGIEGDTTDSVIMISPSSDTTTPGPTYSNLPYSYSHVTCTATRDGVMSSRSFCAVSGGTSAKLRATQKQMQAIAKHFRFMAAPKLIFATDGAQMNTDKSM